MGTEEAFGARWGLVPRPYRVAGGVGEVPVRWAGVDSVTGPGTPSPVLPDTVVDVDGPGRAQQDLGSVRAPRHGVGPGRDLDA